MQALRHSQENHGKLSKPYLCLKLLTCELHQYDDMAYQYLSRPSWLNFIMDDHAKKLIWGLEGMHFTAQYIFPLKPFVIFVGNKKMTFNTGDSLRFWFHQQLAKELLFKLGILKSLGFKEVTWRLLYDTIHEVPWLFQL